jgi:hypothetical protein
MVASLARTEPPIVRCPAQRPNPSFERTAEKLRFSVPSLRSAAAQLER